MPRFIMPTLPKSVTTNQLLDTVNAPASVIEWRKQNRLAIAKFMRALPKERHNQGTYCGIEGGPSNGFCGTRTCVLGWFMVGGLSPHMNWTYFQANFDRAVRRDPKGKLIPPGVDSLAVVPVVNNVALVYQYGIHDIYSTLGNLFFGADAQRHVFDNPGLDKDEVVERLEDFENFNDLDFDYTEDVDFSGPAAKVLAGKAPRQLEVQQLSFGDASKRFKTLKEFKASDLYSDLVKHHGWHSEW